MLDGQAVDLAEKLVQTRGIGLTVSARSSCYAKLLDDLERLLAFESSYDPAQSAGKPANVVVKRKVFFSRRSRGWHGVKISQSPWVVTGGVAAMGGYPESS
jgi:hypothetical protein